MVSGTASGLSAISGFNIEQEKAKWSSIVATQPSTSSSSASDSKKKIKIGPSSCFIATAAYGSETAEQLDTLRAFRDKVLIKNEPGRWFVETYYNVSPPLAEFIEDKDWLRAIVRIELLYPIIFFLNNTMQCWSN